MTSGKARFYADENVEAYLVKHIRNSGIRVEYANELGFNPRDDLFHLQEARRRKCILLTRDLDYLDHREFSFDLLKDTAVVILRTEKRGRNDLSFGYALVSLFDVIAASGRQNLAGLKIELKGPKIIFHANIGGQIKVDEIDISKRDYGKLLFQD
jgi:predicted nuclease of predicted toxin-antitoxin system